MGFFTCYPRSNLSPIFKHPLAKTTISQSSNLSNNAKLSGSTCNYPRTLLFSRAHKWVHYPSSNLGLTHLRNFHKGHGTHYTASVSDYLARKWGSWSWIDKVHYSMLGCVVFTWLFVCNWETVPYTNRKHYIPSSDIYDSSWIDTVWYGGWDDEFKSHIVDQNDPTSKRVFKITKDLLRALQKDLKLGDGSMTLSYWSECEPTKEKFERVPNKSWLQRIQERKIGKYHLNSMHWGVMVVDGPRGQTCCLPNGKIIVTTKLLKLCESDDEIATVIGHEVGHVVARHSIEQKMIHPLILTVLLFNQLGILKPIIDGWFLNWRKALVDYPISRCLEAEADRIGMMLSASAGYDPRKAPGVYMKLFGDKTVLTHPTGKKRAEMLTKESIMQEAVALYNKAISESKQDHEN